MITKFAQVLERLEYVLSGTLVRLVRLDSILCRMSRLRFGEVVIQLLLNVRQLAEVVLNDLRGKIIQNVFF